MLALIKKMLLPRRAALPKSTTLGEALANESLFSWPSKETVAEISQAGFTALELAATLGVIGLLSVVFWALQQNNTSSTKDQVQAQQLAAVATALQKWAVANESTAETNAAAGGGAYVVPIATLQAAPGYLSASFVNQTPYGGSYAPMVRKIAAGQIETLTVVVGGDTMTTSKCRQIGDVAGAIGGCILSGSPTLATGSYNGWQIALAGYAPAGVTMAAGHLAATAYIAGGAVISNYVSSTLIPGHPEANTWKTTMYGGGYPLANVGDVTGLGKIYTSASYAGGLYLYPSQQQAINSACPLGGAQGQNATNGSPLYCDTSTNTWKQPPAVANFVVWY